MLSLWSLRPEGEHGQGYPCGRQNEVWIQGEMPSLDSEPHGDTQVRSLGLARREHLRVDRGETPFAYVNSGFRGDCLLSPLGSGWGQGFLHLRGARGDIFTGRSISLEH